jgi:hypothetical protein
MREQVVAKWKRHFVDGLGLQGVGSHHYIVVTTVDGKIYRVNDFLPWIN